MVILAVGLSGDFLRCVWLWVKARGSLVEQIARGISLLGFGAPEIDPLPFQESMDLSLQRIP